ncbi:MAG TPA: hypothetical protein PK274_01500 [Candidatus Fermentibacter daniensis]|nr:hypothetical protein [Candidatus Fermentibacter daniensis]
MSSNPLENLMDVGLVRQEPALRDEFEGLVRSGGNRLSDAANEKLSFESRFDLAYNGAFSLSLAALRRLGYRPVNRFVVFQALPHTLGLGPGVWATLAECHRRRNSSEYEGFLVIDEQLLKDLIASAGVVLEAVEKLEPPLEP